MYKSYSIRIKFKNTFKDLRFLADDTSICEKKWKEACQQIDEIGETSNDSLEFFKRVKSNFISYGFMPVKK